MSVVICEQKLFCENEIAYIFKVNTTSMKSIKDILKTKYHKNTCKYHKEYYTLKRFVYFPRVA